MKVYNLQKKRIASEKEKVHLELVDYFVNLDAQHKLWHFTIAINLHAQGHHFTAAQAEELVEHLAGHFGIRMANVESALAFSAYCRNKKSGRQNLIRFEKSGVSDDQFEMQIDVLYTLLQNKIMEYRQAIELVIRIIDYYPDIREFLANSEPNPMLMSSRNGA